MGLHKDGTPDDVFRPDEYMTRGMVGTTLSRIIFGDAFNGQPGHRWDAHLNILHKIGIIKSTTTPHPRSVEKRKNAFLMIYRTDKKFHKWRELKDE